MTRPLAAVALLLCLARPAVAGGDRVVLLVANRSANPAAPAELAPALTAALARKGYEVVAGPQAAHAESMSPADAAKLLEQNQAKRVVVVTVHFLLDKAPRAVGPKASPAIGLTAKAFTADRVSWRNSLGLIADDDEQAAKRKRPLAAQASARLLWSFPRGAGPAVASAEQEWDEVTGVVELKNVSGIKDYDVLIERLRSSRSGPRFRLKTRK
jgi:hypothetical protein